MDITDHPLHRSGRALLTHPAPASGDDAEALLPRMGERLRACGKELSRLITLLPAERDA